MPENERRQAPTPEEIRKAHHAIHYLTRAARQEWFADELEEAIRIIVRDEMAEAAHWAAYDRPRPTKDPES